MNNNNLIPFNTVPPELHRELSRKGGKASGAARRAKREKIQNIKAQIIALKELKHDELYMLHNDIKELRQIHKTIR